MLGLDTGTVTDMEKFWAGRPGCGREDERQRDKAVSVHCVGTSEKFSVTAVCWFLLKLILLVFKLY